MISLVIYAMMEFVGPTFCELDSHVELCWNILLRVFLVE